MLINAASLFVLSINAIDGRFNVTVSSLIVCNPSRVCDCRLPGRPAAHINYYISLYGAEFFLRS